MNQCTKNSLHSAWHIVWMPIFTIDRDSRHILEIYIYIFYTYSSTESTELIFLKHILGSANLTISKSSFPSPPILISNF